MTTVDDVLAKLLDPYRFDEVRHDAALIGHVVKRTDFPGAVRRKRWECSCGMYNLAFTGAVARDEAIAHLKQAILDNRLEADRG